MTVGKVAEEAFRTFATAREYKEIIEAFHDLCHTIGVDRTDFRRLYRSIKDKVQTPEIKVLYNLIDKRAKQAVYEKNKACSGAKILVVGAGPCGLRMAIEGALLGGRVIVVEMRDYFARNNVLHLWPFVIQDLKLIGAKYFYPGFCTGSLNHISIRRLQSILLKIALLLGVEVHAPVMVSGLMEPEEDDEGNATTGWRVELTPEVPGLSNLDIDIIVGADGKRNTVPGFERKVFRGKPAIAITCNFVNFRTRADAQVEEIGGIFYIFKQEFFDDLKARSGIDLENFVFYKNDTHYFVMTAKKHCLLEKGVLYEDCAETAQLLRRENINKEKLRDMALEAATIATKGKIPVMQFATNHRGEDDVAIFDFTAMTQATHASLVTERAKKRLLKCIVGDSLIEPFWPTGSGCARGWLSVFDAAWNMRSWCPGKRAPLDVLGEREALLKTLSQASPRNLKPKIDLYTIDPTTRYGYVPTSLKAEQVRHLWDNDDLIENPPPAPMRRFTEAEILTRRRGRSTSIDGGIMLSWYQERLSPYHDIVTVTDLLTSWKNGRAFCALVHSFRPDLIDMEDVVSMDSMTNLRRAFNVIETEWSLSPLLSPEDMVMSDSTDTLALLSYLTQLKDMLEKEANHSYLPAPPIARERKMSNLGVAPPSGTRSRRPSAISLLTGMSEMIDIRKPMVSFGGVTSHVDVQPATETDIRDACTGIAAQRIKALQAQHSFNDEDDKKQSSPDTRPSGGRTRTISGNWMIQTTSSDSESDSEPDKPTSSLAEQLTTSGRLQELTTMFNNMGNNSSDGLDTSTSPPRKPITLPSIRKTQTGGVCCICGKPMFIMERHSHNGYFFHRHCARCHTCQCPLRVGSLYIHTDDDNVKFFCMRHATKTGHFASRWQHSNELAPVQEEQQAVSARWTREENKENLDESDSFLKPGDDSPRARQRSRSPRRRRVMFDDDVIEEEKREQVEEEIPVITEQLDEKKESLETVLLYTEDDIDLGLGSSSEDSESLEEDEEDESTDGEEEEEEEEEEEDLNLDISDNGALGGGVYSNGTDASSHSHSHSPSSPIFCYYGTPYNPQPLEDPEPAPEPHTPPATFRTEARLVIKLNGQEVTNGEDTTSSSDHHAPVPDTHTNGDSALSHPTVNGEEEKSFPTRTNGLPQAKARGEGMRNAPVEDDVIEKPKMAVRRRSKAGLGGGAKSRPPSTVYRQSASLRLLLAYEIQSGLESVDLQEEVLEQRGRQVEEGLRSIDQLGTPECDAGDDHQELLDEWLEVLQQKQELRTKELRLLLKKKLLDLQERKKKIQNALTVTPTSLDLLDEMVDVTRDIKEVEEEIADMASQSERRQAVLEGGDQLDMPASFV